MKIKQTMIMGCLGATMTLLFAGGALAVKPVAPPPPPPAAYCNIDGTANSNGLSLSDMTFNGNNADDCYGVVLGNLQSSSQSTATLNGLNLWQADGAWEFLAASLDNPSGSSGGFSFSLTADNDQTSGDWTLTATDQNGAAPPNLPAYFDFVGVLKASDRYALWFFDDEKVMANNDGTFTINFKNNGGANPDLSHLNLYIRAGEDPGNELPEPGSLALLSLGLLGLGALRRSRKVTI